MDKLRIGFMAFWPAFNPQDNLFTNLLRRNFQVEVTDEAPDFAICSLFAGPPFYYCNFEGPRIFYSGENFSPDFNLFDYCIGFDHLSYGDRFFRLPMWLTEPGVDGLETIHLQRVGREALAQKDLFCNFIHGSASGDGVREDMFRRLSGYRRVESAGRYLNNMPDGWVADNAMDDYGPKKALQRRCKFTLCFESTQLPGFCTEKLTHAFEARTIPIYYGDRRVAETFNSKAFINCHEFADFDAVVRRVRQLDADDDAYLEMLNQPVFNQPHYVSQAHDALADYLRAVCSQPREMAFRRSRCFEPKRHEDQLLEYSAMKQAGERAAQLAEEKRRRGVGHVLRRAGQELKSGGPAAVARRVRARLGVGKG